MLKLDPHKRASLLLTLQQAWEAVNEIPTATPCEACSFYRDTKCRRWDNQIVPKEARAAGCDEFNFDPQSVPF